MWIRRDKLRAIQHDRDALSAAISGLLEANHDLTVANQLLRAALSHSLAGRDADAWAIIGEFNNTRSES